MSDLPDWPGADACYSRAYAALRTMGSENYAAFCKRKRPRVSDRCTPTADMLALIDALNRGDEEYIKGFLLERRVPLHHAESV